MQDPDKSHQNGRAPKTAGIAAAQKGALAVLQFTPNHPPGEQEDFAHGEATIRAAEEVSTYHAPQGDQAQRHKELSSALKFFLVALVYNCPPGPERSTAISRAREAKMWASAGIALEGK